MKISDFFAGTFLFRGIKEDTIEKLLSGAVKKRRFERGELIYSANSYENMLGFVLSGECEITSNNSRVPLNTLRSGESFGITAIFSAETEFPTNIYSRRTSEIFFIEKESLFHMMDECPEISKNIINFLVGRITFLNKKITTFSSENVESKLASYLLVKLNTLGECFELNLSHTAEEINAGRASLYRALTTLESEGVITRSGKKIVINNSKGLERK